MKRLAGVIDDIKAKATIKDAPEPQSLEMHLDSLDSVRKAAADFNSRFDRLDVLICNAGVMACPQTKTQDGLELQIGTNHFAHFLFFQLIRPLILSTAAKTGAARVITVSSSGHRRSGIVFDDIHFTKEGSYEKWTAYGQSKTANIYMANAIDRRYGDKGVRGISLHPGGIFTDLPRHLSQDELKMFDGMDKFFKNPEQGQSDSSLALVDRIQIPSDTDLSMTGAATQVWAAVSSHFGDKGGVYLSDTGEASPYVEGKSGMFSGDYNPHAYDEASEEQLWKISCETVGVNAEN